MEAKHTNPEESTGRFYDCLEVYAQQHLQAWLQDQLGTGGQGRLEAQA